MLARPTLDLTVVEGLPIPNIGHRGLTFDRQTLLEQLIENTKSNMSILKENEDEELPTALSNISNY